MCFSGVDRAVGLAVRLGRSALGQAAGRGVAPMYTTGSGLLGGSNLDVVPESARHTTEVAPGMSASQMQ